MASTESYYEHVKEQIQVIHNIINEIKCLDTKNNPKKLGNKVEIIQSKFKTSVDFFQEQSHLLGKNTGIFVHDLLEVIRSGHKSGESVLNVVDVSKVPVQERDKVKIDLAFSCLYLITKVGGFKSIIRHFPHEVSDVEPVMDMITAEDPLDKSNWETKYVLLLWLSVLVLIPLDLKRFDSCSTVGRQPLIQRIYDIVKTYLNVNLVVSKYAASFLAAKFFTRPEIESTYLDNFVTWCLSNVKQVPDRCSESEAMTLQLMALTYLFKIGKRETNQPHGVKILKAIQSAKLTECKDDNLLKCIMKLVQRIGLVFLRTKIAPWRYQRGKRFIDGPSSNIPKPIVGGDAMDITDDAAEDEDDDDDYAFEELETVIDILLTGLRSPSTLIRWSAAKGIGRICNRLPKSMAVSVLDSVLDLFSHRESNSAWHAACLTLAELGRRGLILPNDLRKVFNVVEKALVYDEVKGCCSVGSDVRDAACYVAWAFGRAYDKETMAPFVSEMASSLIIVSLFDREVNCRRAAAAAFQENVGRQGQFPNGIDIVTTIDYASVGQKKNCFTELVTFMVQFDTYQEPLLKHLVERKVNHWDSEIRQLASEAIHRLCLVVSEDQIRDLVLPTLIEHSKAYDINARHGSLMAMAQVLAALRLSSRQFPDILEEHIRGLYNLYQSKKYLTGHGSALMKQGFCTLILEVSNWRIPLALSEVQPWVEVIKSTIFDVNRETRDFGVKALPSFCRAYLLPDEDTNRTDLSESLFESIIGRIRDMDEGVRCGVFESMTVFPISLISEQNCKLFLDIAINYILSEKLTDKSMTDARACAITCVTNFIIKLSQEKNSKEFMEIRQPYLKKLILQVYNDCLMNGLSDYTMGSKGDIGFVVRKCSLIGIHDLTLHLLKTPEYVTILTENLEEEKDGKIMEMLLLTKILYSILTLCTTNHEWMRVIASQTFITLFQSISRSVPSLKPHVPHIEEISSILQSSALSFREKEEDEDGGKEEIDGDSTQEEMERNTETEDENVADPTTCFDTFIQFLPLQSFTSHLWLGLVPSLGGIAVGTAKQSRASFSKFLKQSAKNGQNLNQIYFVLYDLFKANISNPRLALPFLKTYHFLIQSGHLDTIATHDIECIKNILTTTWTCIKPSSDPSKKIEGAAILCSSLRFKGVSSFALKYIVILLCSPLRPVRIATADMLQVALITYSENILEESAENGEERIEKCSDLLEETDWAIDTLVKLKEVRNQVCTLLNVKPPVATVVSPK